VSRKFKESEELKSSEDEINMPTKLNLRLQIQDDPLLKYEDTRSHSRVSTLSSEGWKAAYLI
jgi:hypothetical protein